jgi:hypothetical protein
VRYDLQITDRDQAYLDNLPLSDKGRDKLSDFVDYAIAQVHDDFRNDPANRPAPGHFQRDFLILDTDPSGNATVHKINFIVKDDTAGVGVLTIVYVELVYSKLLS